MVDQGPWVLQASIVGVMASLGTERFPGPSKGTTFPKHWRQGLTPQIMDSFFFHSTFIGPEAAKNKGGISRYLANKCSIASWIDCFSEGICVWEEASRISWGAAALLWDWRDFTKESGCQAGGSGSQEVVAEITRKLEKKEKKLLKKEKKHLAAISLISSENSSSFSKGCEETSGRPMEKKRQKPQEAPQENGEDPSVSFSKL